MVGTPYGSSRYGASQLYSYGFTGQRTDDAMGLDYFVARYYDPVVGQFTSPDSVPDALNRFGYVGGNPETRTDPSGRFWIWGTSGGTPYSAAPRTPEFRLPNYIGSTVGFDFSMDECQPKGYYSGIHESKKNEEARDGPILADYFGVHFDRLNSNDPLNAAQGYDGKWHFADYEVYGAATYTSPIEPLPARTPKYKVDLYQPEPGTDWDNSDGAAQPGGIVRQIIKKGDEQASIVVVDLSLNYAQHPVTESEAEMYALRAIYAPYSERPDPSHVARVIFIKDNKVWVDVDPFSYGPPKKSDAGPPLVP